MIMVPALSNTYSFQLMGANKRKKPVFILFPFTPFSLDSYDPTRVEQV